MVIHNKHIWETKLVLSYKIHDKIDVFDAYFKKRKSKKYYFDDASFLGQVFFLN